MEARVLMGEFDRTIKELGAASFASKGMLPYTISAALLANSGKKIDRDGVVKLLRSVYIEPDPDLLKDLESIGYTNYILYLHILYYLLVIGKEPDANLMERVGKALGMKPDSVAIEYVLKMYSNNEVFQ